MRRAEGRVAPPLPSQMALSLSMPVANAGVLADGTTGVGSRALGRGRSRRTWPTKSLKGVVSSSSAGGAGGESGAAIVQSHQDDGLRILRGTVADEGGIKRQKLVLHRCLGTLPSLCYEFRRGRRAYSA